MVMVWAATIAGVVLVAIELGGWPYDQVWWDGVLYLKLKGLVVTPVKIIVFQSFIMENPHPVLGSAALILTFIQPLIAMIRSRFLPSLFGKLRFSSWRPHPESRSRWIFNWTHWFVGNSAHVIGGCKSNLCFWPQLPSIAAIMAMFFAIELEKAKVERVVTWILVVYVIFHVFSHIVLR